MVRGSRLPVHQKAQIARKRLIEGKTGVQIAKETGIPERTVNGVIKEDLSKVCQHSEIIARIIENDMETLNIGAELNKRFATQVKAKPEVERNDIETVNNINKEAFKRSQIYQGRATDKVEHELSEEQMRIIAGRYLK